MKLIRAAIAATTIGLVLAGCHQDPYDVAAVYKPHASDTVLAANWDDGQQRYEIAYRHFDLVTFHWLCAYPPEHYSPPDNVWALDWGCDF